MIPRIVHFVFGLEEQREPFHFAHYMAVEASRRMLQPDAVHFHCKHLPWGPLWDRLEPHLTVQPVDLVPAVLGADYSSGLVPLPYRYAHHADFLRLDALIEHGGVYVDIDMVLVRPLPEELFSRPFVIGSELPTRDEVSGELRPSLCNAFLMAEKGSAFASAWRDAMARELNGTWSNHSGFLAERLSRQMPDDVYVAPTEAFYPFPADPEGLAKLFLQRHELPAGCLGVHLWAHLWWERSRLDFSPANAGWCTPGALRRARTTMGELARPYLEERGCPGGGVAAADPPRSWLYFSYDEASGYTVAADRCRAALEQSGQPVDWTPFVRGSDNPYPYAPPALLYPFYEGADAGPLRPGDEVRGDPDPRERDQVVVAHMVPEFFPILRQHCGEALLVGHTAWETDLIPSHWVACLDSVDLVVVPSSFSAAAIAARGVSAPVAVVPHVAPETRRHSSRLFEEVPGGTHVFYTIAPWGERKDVQATVQSYLRAFKSTDDVLLVIKTSLLDWRRRPKRPLPVGQEGTTPWVVARLLSRHLDPPKILLVTRELSEADMASLHARGDCFVSLSRGEGWGLGSFDAAAYGNPVVVTGFGGHLEYLSGWPYLVDYRLVPVEDPAGFPSYAPDQRWAEPDVEHAAHLLRQGYEERQTARHKAALLAEEIRQRYSPGAVASLWRDVVGRRLAEHVAARP